MSDSRAKAAEIEEEIEEIRKKMRTGDTFRVSRVPKHLMATHFFPRTNVKYTLKACIRESWIAASDQEDEHLVDLSPSDAAELIHQSRREAERDKVASAQAKELAAEHEAKISANPWKVGDRVQWGTGAYGPMTVTDVEGDRIRVNGGTLTYAADTVTRCPEPEVVAADRDGADVVGRALGALEGFEKVSGGPGWAVDQVSEPEESTDVEEDPPEKGDYVLATKYADGDPEDPWMIGYYDHSSSLHTTASRRHHVVNPLGQSFRPNGFRRCGKISAEEGLFLQSLDYSEDIGLWHALRGFRAETDSPSGAWEEDPDSTHDDLEPVGATKADSAKVDLTLVPGKAINAIAQAMEYGASKYGRAQFLQPPHLTETRLLAGVLRHIMATLDGETWDPESHLPHTYHAAAGLAMLHACHCEESVGQRHDLSQWDDDMCEECSEQKEPVCEHLD